MRDSHSRRYLTWAKLQRAYVESLQQMGSLPARWAERRVLGVFWPRMMNHSMGSCYISKLRYFVPSLLLC